jgi:tripeptide aminopeptidase
MRLPIRCLLICLAAAVPLAAQVQVPSTHPRLRAAMTMLQADNAWTLDQQVSICEIPAPPFKEAARGAEYRRRFEALGLKNVRVDAVGNVIGERPGTGGGPTVVIAGHLDTVFPEETDVTVRRTGGRLSGPGIGDDCRGLAVVLAVARAFERAGVQTAGTIVFIGNVGEEGPGNLRGMRHLFGTEMKGRIDYFISVDGTGLDITHRAVGSVRYKATFKGPGGHSYGAFGTPNPIHALGRAIAQIGDLQVPSSPRTTFNVGIVGGGTSVNSIPFEGTAEIDMRSESPEALNALDAQVQRILRGAVAAENARWAVAGRAPRGQVSLQLDTIGIRPASSVQTESSPIVAAALASGRALGFTAGLGASSTDANIPMSLGIPAITIDGGGRGGDAHALTEWYEDGDRGWLGPQWAALLLATLAGIR